MKGIDYIAERGMGAWLRARREQRGMTLNDVAQAASLASRTVSRYENDEGIGYETLRVLDALGVQLKPSPARSGPMSVNGELKRLREELAAAAAADAERWDTIDRRLRSLEESAALIVQSLQDLAALVAAAPLPADAAGRANQAR